MITEDYVSFETAKLLKEKGFDEICSYIWGITHIDKSYILQKWIITNGQIKNSDLTDGAYTAPTQSLVLKWLREVYKIHIAVNIGCDVDNKNYVFYTPTIVKLSNKSVEYIEPFSEDDNEFDNNEQAVEAALKYTLENLI